MQMKSTRWIKMACLVALLLTLPVAVAPQSRLGSGKKIKAGNEIKGKKGILFMRFTGDLTLYDADHKVIWETATYIDYGQQLRFLRMSKNGDLEIIVTDDDTRKPSPLWSSKTSEKYGAEARGAHLEIDWEKLLLKIVSKSGKVLWSSQ
jgi:hypothetical protein